MNTQIPPLFSAFLNPNENFLDITQMDATILRFPLSGSLDLSFTPTEKKDCYELRFTRISFLSSPVKIKRNQTELLFTIDPKTPSITQGAFECQPLKFSAAVRMVLTVDPETSLLPPSILSTTGQLDFYPANNVVTASLTGFFPQNVPFVGLGRFNLLLFCQDGGERKDPVPVKDTFKLGKTDISLITTTAPGALSNCFLIIHDNENTATKAVLAHIKANGGKLIELDSGGTRNVTFETSDGKTVTFDPNRMFSDEGLKKDLKDKNTGKKYEDDAKVLDEIRKLRDKVLKAIENCDPVIAVHNNTDGSFSIESYKKNGSEEKQGNTRKLDGNPNIVAGEDPDNFFLVTKKEDFDKIKGKYNVVLQTENNDSTQPGGKGPNDDGSLSVKLKDKRYINLEVQHEQEAQQIQMLADLEKAKKCETLKK